MSDLYSSVYNPDVLSCLANLSSDEVFTPPHIVNQMLDLLPQELFRDKNTKFLDPACKSGVFLREIAKRLLEGLKEQIPDLQTRIDHIFHNQLYGIAVTEMTSLLSRRSVYCSKYPNSKYSISPFSTSEGNIRFKRYEHLWEKNRCVVCGANKADLGKDKTFETHAYELIHLKKPEEIHKMKFDVIIGNPPYHLNDGGGTGSSAIPIYHKFIEQSKKLNPKYLSMIIPARWFTGGKGLDDFRAKMIKDRKLVFLHDFINSSECFPNVNLEGGVCYFLMDRTHNDKCEIYTHKQNGNIDHSRRFLDEENLDVFVRDYKVLEIVKKVLAKKMRPFSELVLPRNPFGISNSSKHLSEDKSTGYTVLGRFNGKRDYKGFKKSELLKNIELVQKYKLFVSKADGAAGQIGNPIPARIIGKAEDGKPGFICTETFLTVGPFSSEKQMNNAKSYMKTKFFRFLVGSRKNKNMKQDTYKFVPALDFEKSWDDFELNSLFELTEEEKQYIDAMITEFDETIVEETGGDESDD